MVESAWREPFRDISSWRVLDLPTTGAREKFWAADEKGDLWLFKYSRENTGEHWAEYVSSRLLDVMDLPAPHVELAVFENRIGAVSRRFVDTNSELFFEGVDFVGLGGASSVLSHLDKYTLDRILSALEPFGLASDFLWIPLFDALVGHVDRHPGNWGIIQSIDTGTYRFAPLYDNSSCLGAELLPDRVELLMRDPRAYAAFLFGRPRSLIRLTEAPKGPKHMDMATHIQGRFPAAFSEFTKSLSQLTDETVGGVINPLGDHLGASRVQFVSKVIADRRDELLALNTGD